MIDIEQFKKAVNEAKTKVNTDTTTVDLENKSDLLTARMDWLIARDNLSPLEGTLDSANAQHLAMDFKQHALDHIALMRKYGPSPATGAVLDFYAPLLNVVYTTDAPVVLPAMAPVLGNGTAVIPTTID